MLVKIKHYRSSFTYCRSFFFVHLLDRNEKRSLARNLTFLFI
uniref:Uncharacterized protein n=1 Tax=Rhizophora mucronata TaxID=61149 RepID=A0A2P2R3W3_RHIMU